MSNQDSTATEANAAPAAVAKPIVQQPAYTIREDEAGTRVQVALPGVRKDDVKVTAKQSVLQLEATRFNAVSADWKTYSGPSTDVSYQLGVRLSAKLDGGNVKASFENGVLTLDIPVREDAKPRDILVN